MYAERMVELIIDLLSQLPTRRFFLAVVEGLHVLVRCRLSALHQREEGRLRVSSFFRSEHTHAHTQKNTPFLALLFLMVCSVLFSSLFFFVCVCVCVRAACSSNCWRRCAST